MNEATGFCPGECDYSEEMEFSDKNKYMNRMERLKAKRRLSKCFTNYLYIFSE